MTPPRLTQFDFHHTLAETRGPAVVCFTAPHCGACKAMRQTLTGLGAGDPELRVFEVDCQADTALAREFDLFHLPALFLYRDGEFHAPLEAPPRGPELLRRIRHLLTEPAREAP